MGRNFYTSVKPIVIFMTILGIVPFYYKNNRLCTSLFNLGYVLLLIIMYLAVLYDAMSVKEFMLQQTAYTSYVIFKIMGITQTIAIFINTIAGRKKFIQLSDTMLKCGYAFKKLSHVSCKNIHEKIYVRALIFIIAIVVNYGIQLILCRRTYKNKLSFDIVIFGLPLLLNGNICILAIVHVLEIRHGFTVLNECLRHMKTKQRGIFFQHNAVLNKKFWKPNVENLAMIGTLHIELNNCIRDFNSTFGLLLVAMLVNSFVATLVGAYFAYINYLRSVPIRTVYAVMSSLTFAAYVSTLCQRCSTTNNEVNIRFNSTIHLFFVYFI